MIRPCGQSWSSGGYGKKWPLKNNMQISIRHSWFSELWALCWGPICFFTLGQKLIFFSPGKTDRFLKIPPKPNQACLWFSSSCTAASRTLMASFLLLPHAFLVPVHTAPGIKVKTSGYNPMMKQLRRGKWPFASNPTNQAAHWEMGSVHLRSPPNRRLRGWHS